MSHKCAPAVTQSTRSHAGEIRSWFNDLSRWYIMITSIHNALVLFQIGQPSDFSAMPTGSPSPGEAASQPFDPWPLVIISVAVVVGVLIFYGWRHQFDRWLSTKKRRRLMFFIASAMLLPSIIWVLADVADVSAILTGKVRPIDRWLLRVISFLVPVYLLCESLRYWSADQLDEIKQGLKLSQASARLAQGVLRRFSGVIAGNRRNAFRNALDPARHSPPTLGEVLTNRDCLATVVHTLHRLIFSHWPRNAEGNSNVQGRVTYFRLDEKKEFVVPIESFDGRDSNCVRSPLVLNQHFFRVAAPAQSLAVQAVLSRAIQIVPSTHKADTDGSSPFRFFNEDQKGRIKSIVAIPFRSVDDEGLCRHLIVVDADMEYFFQEESLSEVELLREVCRDEILLLELVSRLVKGGGEN